MFLGNADNIIYDYDIMINDSNSDDESSDDDEEKYEKITKTRRIQIRYKRKSFSRNKRCSNTKKQWNIKYLKDRTIKGEERMDDFNFGVFDEKRLLNETAKNEFEDKLESKIKIYGSSKRRNNSVDGWRKMEKEDRGKTREEPVENDEEEREGESGNEMKIAAVSRKGELREIKMWKKKSKKYYLATRMHNKHINEIILNVKNVLIKNPQYTFSYKTKLTSDVDNYDLNNFFYEASRDENKLCPVCLDPMGEWDWNCGWEKGDSMEVICRYIYVLLFVGL
jgi:hypothetical protein